LGAAIVGAPHMWTPAPPSGGSLHTRPGAVVPSVAQSAPCVSNAMPFALGTPVANCVAVGGVEAFGVRTSIASCVEPTPVTYSRPAASKVRPLGLHGAGTVPTRTAAPAGGRSRRTGQPIVPPR